jgi:hypothetical protein
MNPDHDFTALRHALRQLSAPMEPEVNRFLIEFHRRQRAQLLVPQSRWARLLGWVREHAPEFAPLSYASGVAALALLAFLTFSGQVQVAPAAGSYQLSLRLPGHDAALAMLPASLVREASSSKADNLTFTPTAAKPGATHFILANTRVAYDATPAF